MTRSRVVACAALFLFCVLPICAQEPATTGSSVVPPLVRFSGVLTDPNGKALTGVVGVTFHLYKDAQTETPLWMETQNVRPDTNGRYSVQLGSTKPNGLPTDVFVSGEARWVGVQIEGQLEQPRVLLLSVPYALKAADAETVGGLPPSAFVLVAPPSAGATASDNSSARTGVSTLPPSGAVTGTGTLNFVPKWDSTSDIVSSVIFQSGTGSTAKIGINTTSPATTLDVSGAGTVRGAFTLPTTGTATVAAGKNSQPLNLSASVFNSGTGTAVSQNFRWQAEPVGNDTSSASGSLNLLYASGSNTLTETGLSIASSGLINFASGQTFPDTGDGTVTSVGSGAGLTGGPITSSGTLSIDTNKVPQLTTPNTFTGNQTVNGNVSATGQLISTVAQGMSPLQVTSTTQVPNLNASLLGGSSASAFQQAGSYATLGSNSFNGNQGVSGDVNVTGLVFANSISGQYSVYGLTNNTVNLSAGTAGQALGGSGKTFGVSGLSNSSSGAGVYGVEGAQSATGGASSGGAGVWADAGNFGISGVLATADNAHAVVAVNNSTNVASLTAGNNTLTQGAPAFQAYGNFGTCTISVNGNLTCTGSKSAVVPVDGGSRKVALYAVEAPENWFEDAGSGQLSNGSVFMTLEPTFAQTVNVDVEYHVFLTPKGDCEGLYVTNETAAGFEVHELRGGHSNIAFDYRIMARRKGYETIRLVDMTDSFKSTATTRKTK